MKLATVLADRTRPKTAGSGGLGLDAWVRKLGSESLGLEPSCSQLRPSHGSPGAILGASGAVLEPAKAVSWQSWGHPGVVWGSLGGILEPHDANGRARKCETVATFYPSLTKTLLRTSNHNENEA